MEAESALRRLSRRQGPQGRAHPLRFQPVRGEEDRGADPVEFRQAAEGSHVHLVFPGLPFGIGPVRDTQGLRDLLLGIAPRFAFLRQFLYEAFLVQCASLLSPFKSAFVLPA